MYFIFVNNLDFPKYVVKCCQGCVFKQLLQNNTLRTGVSYKLFHSLSTLLFFENSSSKASGLLFIFVHVSMGHAHFSNDEIHISCEPDRPNWVFLSHEKVVNTVRKAWFKVCGESLRPVFNPAKKPAFEQSLPVRKCNTGII